MVAKTIHRLTALIFCFLITPKLHTTTPETSTQTLSESIAKEYIHANTPEDVVDDTIFLEGFRKNDPPILTRNMMPTLTKREQHNLAFDSIKTAFSTDIDPENEPLKKNCIEKMELLSGGEKKDLHYLNSLFAKVQTIAGKAWVANQLCYPTTDQGVLKNRQSVLLTLISNEQTLNQLYDHYTKITKTESEGLFCRSSKFLPEGIKQMFYRCKMLPWLEKQELTYELRRALATTATLGYEIAVPLLYTGIGYIAGQTLKPGCGLILAPAGLGFGLWIDTALYYMAKIRLKIRSLFQKNLIDMATYLDNVRAIKNYLEKNPEIVAYLPRLACILDLDDASKHSDDFNYVIKTLQTNTFKGEPSYFSRVGRIFKTYKLLPGITKELEPIVAAIGELDAYVGLAKRFKELEGTQNQLCFATFVQDGPYLEAKNFWNPSVLYHKDHVIPNDIIMTQAHGDSKPNIVVTGPNTGGKSTVLKGLFLDVLLAQTFGVAAADEFIVSPFTLLNCYLNITDDIAAGVSLFKAEVLRARELIEGIRNLKPNELSFTIMDETFSGTSPKEGEAASYTFAESLGKFDNSLCILATHYHKLIDLETGTNRFKNMHVEVIRQDDNSLTFTYKIKDGPSKMNIAMDILAEQGII